MSVYPKRVEGLAFRVVERQAVIVSPGESEVTVLNEVGTLIWELIDGSYTITQIAQKLCAQFMVSQQAAEKDIVEFVADLRNKKLVAIFNAKGKVGK